MKPYFKCCYDGAADYEYRGKRYVVRHAEPSTQAEPDNRLVGCVYGYCGAIHDYPPQELLDHFQGYAAARYAPTGETYEIDTTCGKLTVDRCQWEFQTEPRQGYYNGRLTAQAWIDELSAYEAKRQTA